MSIPAGPVWMTQAALDRLLAEEAELSSPEHADDQPTRVRLLEVRELIRRAEVSEKPDDGLVEPGMVVTIRFANDGSEETFLLGSREAVGADANIEVSSPTSPLGAAISGSHVGETVRFTAPTGAQLDVAIISAVPFV